MASHTPHNSKTQAKRFALQLVEEIFDDPDFGKELSTRTKKRLQAARTRKTRSISFADIKKKYL